MRERLEGERVLYMLLPRATCRPLFDDDQLDDERQEHDGAADRGQEQGTAQD